MEDKYSILHNNYSRGLKKEERDNILNTWIKSIRKQIIIDFFSFIILSSIIYFLSQGYFEDNVKEIAKYFVIIILISAIVRAMWKVYYEFAGYVKSQNGNWTKTLIFIESIDKGKLEGIYVKTNGELFKGIIKCQYGENVQNLRAQSFATIIYFESVNKYMLSSDNSWIVDS